MPPHAHFIMIAAHEDPGSRLEQQAGRRGEIRAPRRPGVAKRAASATEIAGWARRLAIVEIAGVNDEVGP